MSAPCSCTAELASLEKRLAALEKRMESAAPAIDEHEDRLDEHERQLSRLADGLRDVGRSLAAVAASTTRLADFATTQGLSLERIEGQQRRVVQLLEKLTAERDVTSALEAELSRVGRHG